MTTKYHQIFLNDIFLDYQNKLIVDFPSFFDLPSEHLDLDKFIPSEFQSAFYLSLRHNQIYSLHGFLSAFILQKIFSIPTNLAFFAIVKTSRALLRCGIKGDIR